MTKKTMQITIKVEITTQRKNRRGQRARQKIWAKKYGKAKHVKKNQEILASERERDKWSLKKDNVNVS